MLIDSFFKRSKKSLCAAVAAGTLSACGGDPTMVDGESVEAPETEASADTADSIDTSKAALVTSGALEWKEGLQQRLDFSVLGRRQWVEGAVIGEDVLGDEHVEVDVQLKGRAEPLDEADCATLAGRKRQAACPKSISIDTIARMNREWVRAFLFESPNDVEEG